MFSINDIVVHYRDGVATIVDKTSMAGNEYFVLHVKRLGDVSIYVPCNDPSNVIRPLLTHEDISNLIKYAKELEVIFVGNTKKRRDEFKSRLASKDVHDVIYLCKLLYLYKTLPELPDGVKFGAMDVDMLLDAHRRLFDELSVVLNVDVSDVEKQLIKYC